MKDRPFEVGFREQASNHPKRHRSKAVVVSVAGNVGRIYRSGVDHGDERERTTDDVSKAFSATSKPGGVPFLLGQAWGGPMMPPDRHPACRWRDRDPGLCTERENLSLRCEGSRQKRRTARP